MIEKLRKTEHFNLVDYSREPDVTKRNDIKESIH